MNKFYLFLAAAGIAVSASAFDRELLSERNVGLPAEQTANVMAPFEASKQIAPVRILSHKNMKFIRKAGEAEAETKPVDYAYFRAASNIGMFGMSAIKGNGYLGIGFASAYGNLDFKNLSSNVKTSTWTFAEIGDYEVVGTGQNQTLNWHTRTSNEENLSIKSKLGEVLAPSLAVEFNSGKRGSSKLNATTILCGGGADYYGANENAGDDIIGITFYQNQFVKDPQGYTGATIPLNSYSKDAKQDSLFNKNGVCIDWQEQMDSIHFPGKKVTDIALEKFLFLQPKPASTYVMSQAWIWMSVSVAKATQLISYIYPVDDEGNLAEMPIAISYAAIPRTGTSIPVFKYSALNEDGDETDDDILIDTPVAISVEGFSSNKDIISILPVSGYYPFSYSAYKGNPDIPFIKSPDLYLSLSMKVDGELVTGEKVFNPLGYRYDRSENTDGTPKDGDTTTLLAYAQLSTDAVYPFIFTADGNDTLTLPKVGGKVDVELESLFLVCAESLEQGLFEITTPEWIEVTAAPLDQIDEKRPFGKITISTKGSDDRTGIVTIKSLGVSLDLKVVQGQGSGVDMVNSDGEAHYFDLTGNRVYNPGKGVYVKVSGGKAEKVVL